MPPLHPGRARLGGGRRVALAVALVLLALVAGCGRGDAEAALREDIAALQAAIEARDAGAMADHLAGDFVGSDGMDRDGARRLAALYFMRHGNVGVTAGPLEVELRGDHATVRTTVVVTGGSGGLLPDTGRVRDVTTGWRREDGDWRMTSLRWENR